MNNITVSPQDGILVVDSRIVAEALGINHKTLLDTIEKYRAQIEQFGVLAVETRKPPEDSKGGRPQQFVYLNENQAIFVATLSRNTDRVVQFKLNLVQAFSEAKQQIRLAPVQAQLAPGLFTQLCNGNAKLEWVLAQCRLEPNGCDLAMHFPSRELRAFFEQQIDSFLEAAHDLGIVECYVYVAGEWQARYPVAAMLGWDAWVAGSGVNKNA